MRLVPTFLWLCLGAITLAPRVNAQPDLTPATNPKPAPVLTPQESLIADVRAFAGALNFPNIGDDLSLVFFSAVPYVADAKIGFFGGQEVLHEWGEARGEAALTVTNVEILELQNNDAKVRVSYLLGPVQARQAPLTETLVMHNAPSPIGGQRNTWQIVTTAAPAMVDMRAFSPDTMGKLLVLNTLAWNLAHPQEGLPALYTYQSIQNLKHLALGASQFVLDYDESFALDAKFAQEAFKPYLRSQTSWQVPGAPRETYAFNPNLSGVSTKAIAHPDQTVLLYDGQNEQPAFRTNGKAAVAFVDGHVKLVTPDEAKALIWKP